MTSGDIDGIFWDFNKKILRIIEAKRIKENQKESQSRLLRFLQDNIKIEGYDFSVYKIIGNAPYDYATIYSYKINQYISVDFNGLKDFLEMNKKFDDFLNDILL